MSSSSRLPSGSAARSRARRAASTWWSGSKRYRRSEVAPPPRLLALQRLGLVVRAQRVDHVVDVSVDDRLQVVLGEPDPVIGQPILREVVGADLVGAIARLHLLAPRLALGSLLLLALDLEQLRAQDLHRLVLVLVLRLLVLAAHLEPRRLVQDLHGRVSRIHRLTAWSARARHLDLEILLLDPDVDLFRLR